MVKPLGPDHSYLAFPLCNVATLYEEQGKYEQAEPLYERALRIREQHLGQHNPETAQTLHDLALFRQKQGNLNEARSLAQRALQIRSQFLGDAHLKTVATRALFTQLVQEQGGVEEETFSELRAEEIPGSLREEKRAGRPMGRDAPTHSPGDQSEQSQFFQQTPIFPRTCLQKKWKPHLGTRPVPETYPRYQIDSLSTR